MTISQPNPDVGPTGAEGGELVDEPPNPRADPEPPPPEPTTEPDGRASGRQPAR